MLNNIGMLETHRGCRADRHRSSSLLLLALGLSLGLGLVLVLVACGPATPEAKVQERAALEFHCPADNIVAKPLDAPTLRRFEASGCGREAVYVNVAPAGDGDNWVLDSPNAQ